MIFPKIHELSRASKQTEIHTHQTLKQVTKELKKKSEPSRIKNKKKRKKEREADD